MRAQVSILLFMLFVFAEANLKFMINENRTPKEKESKELGRIALFTGACDECKMAVSRFAEAVENPKKLEELKDLLRMLCHQTTYEDECRVFVNQLDYFIEKMKPYLSDPEKVCQHFRLCGNKKIERFHQIDMIYGKKYMVGNPSLKGLVCDECKYAATELKNAIENKESEEKLKRFVSEEICSRLGTLQGKCDLMLEEFMPELIEELDKLLQNTNTFCSDLGLCSRSNDRSVDGLPKAIIDQRNYDESIFAKFSLE